jgi:hypothetical protein
VERPLLQVRLRGDEIKSILARRHLQNGIRMPVAFKAACRTSQSLSLRHDMTCGIYRLIFDRVSALRTRQNDCLSFLTLLTILHKIANRLQCSFPYIRFTVPKAHHDFEDILLNFRSNFGCIIHQNYGDSFPILLTIFHKLPNRVQCSFLDIQMTVPKTRHDLGDILLDFRSSFGCIIHQNNSHSFPILLTIFHKFPNSIQCSFLDMQITVP